MRYTIKDEINDIMRIMDPPGNSDASRAWEVQSAERRLSENQRSTSMQNPYNCGDGGCVLRLPGVRVGMHTNAGCRCIPLHMSPDERVRLRKGILWLAERAAEVNDGRR